MKFLVSCIARFASVCPLFIVLTRVYHVDISGILLVGLSLIAWSAIATYEANR